MELKVFEIRQKKEDEKIWVAADTNIEALKLFLGTCDMDMIDLNDDDEIVELPEEEWKKLIVTNSEHNHEPGFDWEQMTFEQYVQENGKGIIAGTPFD